MKSLIVLLVIMWLSWRSSHAEEEVPDAPAASYLPLEVGNSWTYTHEVYDEGVGVLEEWHEYSGEVTITVERIEVQGGHAYYAISNMPETGPPAPPYFIAGRKLRWDGIDLVELTDDGREEWLYPFVGARESDEWRDHYGQASRSTRIPTTPEGDGWMKVSYSPADIVLPLGRHRIRFSGHEEEGWERWLGSRGGTFVEGYGVANWFGIATVDYGSHPEFLNHLNAVRAEIGGIAVTYEDILLSGEIWTTVSVAPWGLVKSLRFPSDR